MSVLEAANMSTPSPTPSTIMGNAQQLLRQNKPDQPETVSSLEASKDDHEDGHPKDLTPPPSPLPSIVEDVITAVIVEDESENENRNETWNWWQGYRKDRMILGFEAPPAGKSVVLPAKRHGGHRKRKRDDD